MVFAGALTQQGIQVIAMSRFGYLRTPMPANSLAAAQADAHVCLLYALGIRKASVMGGSAGAPSALQMATHHPERTSALVPLMPLVPLAYKPLTLADSAPPPPSWVENALIRSVDSDFLLWVALHVANDLVVKVVLATPPELLAAANVQELSRVETMLEYILSFFARARGLRSDTAVDKHLTPSPLESIPLPTLVISVRDDWFGTYVSAQYTAELNAGRFIGTNNGETPTHVILVEMKSEIGV
ncbi:alpha/beta hydrolase [Hydrogenophaga sp.]|uniref:alpha/beta hydrolase n=1 Tax=Hydrogenophaga sp. TaxID=1904254 RepID=UPI00272F0DA1|nr:alpha/beta hydrolase [Hydrogenophaga sp.]MDP2073281.1 alpha/beta hydrolase [Hydrogenophaga sp.]MDP3106682.1 alpha/beta hydrolase [Hydrogenophaga sp.]